MIYSADSVDAVPFNIPIVVTGTLDLGTWTDRDLGFVSRVRLLSATFEKL
ncbi:hypothetical protein [Breoghania sp. L-A4]|nr:hypothetical protein [Breoghania sp. L-A4]